MLRAYRFAGTLGELVGRRRARGIRRHGPARFADDEVREIRLYGKRHPIREVAQHFEIPEQSARNILQYLTYTHVPD